MTSKKRKTVPALVRAACRALDDKKGEDLIVLDVSRISSITDYLVLATGTSEPHLRALRIELERVLDDSGTPIVGRDAEPGSGWVVVDAFDVMFHVMIREVRERFGIESLWADADRVSVNLRRPDSHKERKKSQHGEAATKGSRSWPQKTRRDTKI